MTPLDYVIEMQRTLGPTATSRTIQLGLLGESGEVADLVKKALERGKEVDRQRIVEELGDVLWYMTAKLLMETNPFEAIGILSRFRTRTRDNSIDDCAVDLCDSTRLLGLTQSQGSALKAAREVVEDIASMAALMPATIHEIMAVNIAKLKARYPDGFKVAV